MDSKTDQQIESELEHIEAQIAKLNDAPRNIPLPYEWFVAYETLCARRNNLRLALLAAEMRRVIAETA